MSPAEAIKIIDLPAGATAGQIEARFLDLRRRLEEKIVRAPTPGLQAKYRTALADVEKAAGVLTAAIGSDTLPALKRPAATLPVSNPSATAADLSPALPTKSGTAVRLTAALTLAVLAAGGAWYWQSRLAERELTLRDKADREDLSKASAHSEPKIQVQEQTQEERWAAMTPAELISLARDARVQTEKTAREYEAKAGELERAYRNSSHKPSLWRAETWVEIRDLRFTAQHLRESLAPEQAPWPTIQKFEGLIAAGSVAEAAQIRADVQSAVLDAISVVDQQWMSLHRLTSLDLTSAPPGLTWTIESKYDDGKTLAVSGTTPTKGDQFVGTGNGVLRISKPGSPDFVMEIEHLGLPFEPLIAAAKFTP